jgi:3-oxoacyl-[acyl-carrier protein] reductase
MSNVPIQRAGTSEEMAKVIAFLASEDSSYLVGATIDANGGMWYV